MFTKQTDNGCNQNSAYYASRKFTPVAMDKYCMWDLFHGLNGDPLCLRLSGLQVGSQTRDKAEPDGGQTTLLETPSGPYCRDLDAA